MHCFFLPFGADADAALMMMAASTGWWGNWGIAPGRAAREKGERKKIGPHLPPSHRQANKNFGWQQHGTRMVFLGPKAPVLMHASSLTTYAKWAVCAIILSCQEIVVLVDYECTILRGNFCLCRYSSFFCSPRHVVAVAAARISNLISSVCRVGSSLLVLPPPASR